MTSRRFAPLFQIFSIYLLTLAMMPNQAQAVHWTVDGPGVTDLVVTGNKVIFSYDLDVRRSYGVFEWQLTGHDYDPGTHVFNWDYDGSHDGPQAATILRAQDQELVSAGTSRGAFLYEGKDLVLQNNATEDFHFRMLATNDDATHALTGTLELTIVDTTASDFPLRPFIPAKPFPLTSDLVPSKPFPLTNDFEQAKPFPVAAVPLPVAFWPFAMALLSMALIAIRRGRSVLRNNAQA